MKKLIALIGILLICSCATQKVRPKVQGPKPPIITLQECYTDTVALVLFFGVYDKDGKLEKMIPAPIQSEGCRCIIDIDGASFIAINAIPNDQCPNQKSE